VKAARMVAKIATPKARDDTTDENELEAKTAKQSEVMSPTRRRN
jgi:hypothetical protein